MISGEQEYPELHRKIRLLPKDISLALLPGVTEFLEEAEARIQPVVDRAMDAWTLDIITYGSPQKTLEEYVQWELDAPRREAEAKRHEEIQSFFRKLRELVGDEPSVAEHLRPDWRKHLPHDFD